MCFNNIKQIGLSIQLYAGDYGGRYPSDAAATTVGSFALLANKYQTSFKTWICRSDTGMVVGSSNQPLTRKNISYAYGGFGLTESVQPDTPIACDSTSGDVTSTMPYQGNTWTHKSDGGNVLYADGHVAFVMTMNPPMYRGRNP